MDHAPFDVIVLGAGAAGLTAARQLTVAGRRVALIEARARVGGRIFTRHVPAAPGGPTVPVELGAEFIHGLPPESWRLVREAGLETYELDGSMLRSEAGRLFEPGQRPAASVLEGMGRWLERQPEGTDESFADYLRHTPLEDRARREAIGYVEGFNAADHRVIGVAALARQQGAEDAIAGDRIFHVREGYDGLPGFLRREFAAGGGTLCLEHRVTEIEWRRGNVIVRGMAQGRHFEHRAARAVVTLPLGVLQAASVRFEPVPAAAIAAAARMAMGSVLRVPLLFRSRFWADALRTSGFPALAAELRSLSFLFTDSVPGTWWTAHPDPTPLLIGWLAGPAAAEALARGTGPQLIERCLAALAAVLGATTADMGAQFVSGHCHDWDADDYSRGAYSYMPAGALHASELLAMPVEDTLYFAGEHTATSGHWGTVHGALRSGAAAADKIMASTA